MCEDYRSDSAILEYATAFREGFSHSIFEELLVLVGISVRIPVLHLAQLGVLWRQFVLRVEDVTQQGMFRQCPASSHTKKKSERSAYGTAK